MASHTYAYLATSQLTEPQSYEQAISSPEAEKWKKAMDEEYASLIDNHTWDLEIPPPNQQVIQTR